MKATFDLGCFSNDDLDFICMISISNYLNKARFLNKNLVEIVFWHLAASHFL